MEQVARHKSNGFHEESEVRGVMSPGMYSEKIKHRVKGELLIPYLEFAFDTACIRAIHIGPVRHRDLAKISVRQLVEGAWLGSVGHLDLPPNISIEVSSISFRSLD
jgi:hypothetical protein